MAVEEQDGAESLILRGGRDLFVRYKMGEELVDLRRAHFFRMALVMKENEFLHPKDVGIAGARGVMFKVDDVAVAVKEFFLLRGLGFRNFWRWEWSG